MNNSLKKKDIEKDLPKKISLKKFKISKEISCSFIAKPKKTMITANNNIDFSINGTKNKLDTNNDNKIDHDIRIVFRRNSNSEFKPKKNNMKSKSNFLINNTVQVANKSNKRNIISNFKSSQLNINQAEEMKVYKTINSDDDIITPVQKLSKGFNTNTLTQKNINHKNNNIYNVFNYKVVSLGDKLLLDSDSKDIFALDINNPVNLKKRSIRINLVSPLSHTLKTYRSQKFERKSKKNSPNEVNIKAAPAFGSTAYSFYHRKNFPNITVGKTQ